MHTACYNQKHDYKNTIGPIYDTTSKEYLKIPLWNYNSITIIQQHVNLEIIATANYSELKHTGR